MKALRYVFTLAGLCLLMISAVMWRHTHDSVAGYIPTQAVVAGALTFRAESAGASGASAPAFASTHPVIEFTDQRGEIIHFTPIGNSRVPTAKGSKVNVLYSPFQPQQAVVNDFFALWGMSALLGGLGVFSVLLGILFTVLARRRALR